MMRHTEPERIFEALLDCALPHERRVPQSEDDFGDVQTNFKQLKRIGRDVMRGDMDKEDLFGTYGGFTKEHGWLVFVKGHEDGHWLMFISNVASARIRAVVCYETLEELKREWKLD